MRVLVEIRPEQLPELRTLTASEPIPAALADTGAIVNLQLGPVVLEQLALQLDVHWPELPRWDSLDLQTQTELALLTADPAPWAMDQKLHDTAAEDLSQRTMALLRSQKPKT